MSITEIDDGVILDNPQDIAAPVSTSAAKPVDEILDALMARIAPVGEAPNYFKGLIYGPPGAGKTVFACGAPKTLVVDIERGTQSLHNHEDTKSASVLEFKSVTQLELLLDRLASGALPQFEVLVIDSLTTLQEIDLDAIVKKASSEDASRNPFVPQLQDYNANTNHMRRIGSLLNQLPMHVVAIAQEKEVKDESTGRLLMRPSFTDKLAKSINHLFSTVGHLTVDSEGNRNLQVHPTDKITAKTRIGGLPAVIKNPNILDLLSANSSNH